MNEVEKGKIYRIKDLIIEVPEMEDTKRYMKNTCYSHIASGVYHDKEPFLNNLVNMLQCGFGIYLGFDDNEVIEEDEIK